MPNYFEMEMAADIAEDLYKRRKLKEQQEEYDRDMAARWERMKTNGPATFKHPSEIQTSTAAPGYIPLDAVKRNTLVKPSGSRGRSFAEEQSTQVRNPSFSVTPEERGKQRAKEELDRLNHIEAEVIKSIVSVGEDRQEVKESVNAQMERFKQQANQQKQTDQTYQKVGNIVEKLREQIAKGDTSEETRDLFSEGCQILRMMARRLVESDTGTTIFGTACASQCQSDVLNAANGDYDKVRGEIKDTRKLRGRPISEGRVS